MRLKLLTLALALAAVSLPSHGEDLLDAYRDARANDPVLAQADATRLATGEGVPQARALLLPQVSAGLSLDQVNGGSGGGTTVAPDPNTGQLITVTSQTGHTRTRGINGQVSQTVLDFSKY
ncbi:MAG: type I secretion protein TolC, partial [Rhodanobacter sp.]